MATQRTEEVSADAAVAYSRPPGQADPAHEADDETRMATKLLVAMVGVSALLAWAAWLLARQDTWSDYLVEIVLLSAFAIVSARFPMQIAYKREMPFDLLVVVLAALVLPPEIAIPVCAIGYLFGFCIRYRFRLSVEGSTPMDVTITHRPTFVLAGHAAQVPLIHEGVNPHIQAHIA